MDKAYSLRSVVTKKAAKAEIRTREGGCHLQTLLMQEACARYLSINAPICIIMSCIIIYLLNADFLDYQNQQLETLFRMQTSVH